MKVGSLFAEIGFKIDDEGLKNFEKAMQAFQKKIKSGLNDLKAYAKAAREISDAIKDAYVPSQKEMSSRYRAQTAFLRSQSRTGNALARLKNAETKNLAAQANLANVRAKFFEQDSNTRASNARSRERQLDLKERGLIGTHNGRASRFLGQTISLIGGIISGSIATTIGGLFGPFGALMGKLVDKIIDVIWKATTWVGRTIVAGMHFGMAYRDYRNFTGRSTTALSNLMAGTFNTTNMRPEDVLKDALGLETGFWEMMLGGGNPAAYQLLGVRPTGVGEIDLQNIINAIGEQTGGFQNRGLARTLFKMFGLSEEYLNVELYRSQQKQAIFDKEINALLQNADAFEKTNQTLKEFEWIWDNFKAKVLTEFVKSGGLEELKKWLDALTDSLPDIVEGFNTLFTVISSFCEWLRTEFPTVFDKNAPKSGWERSSRRLDRAIENSEPSAISAIFSGVKEMILHPLDMMDYVTHEMWGTSGDELRQQVSISNTYNVSSAKEAIEIGRAQISDVKSFGFETNNATLMSNTY